MLGKEWMSAMPLTGVLLNRFEGERKRDGFVTERLAAACKPRAAVMSMQPSGVSVLVRDSTHWLHPVHTKNEPLVSIDPARTLYIGEELVSHENIFVADASRASDALTQQCTWASPRSLFGALHASAPASENALFSLCLSMYQWHHAMRFCSRCGGTLAVQFGGLSVKCDQCGAREHPAVVPAIIVAVLDGKGSVLLCQRRQMGDRAVGTKPFKTVLSGFVSHGESMEETVIREVEEESQAKVTSLRYVGSQPWPLPYQLMCAYYAVAPSSGALVAQEDELVSVAWVSKEEVRSAIAGEHPSLTVPPPFTVAHFLLQKWATGEVDDNGLPTR